MTVKLQNFNGRSKTEYLSESGFSFGDGVPNPEGAIFQKFL